MNDKTVEAIKQAASLLALAGEIFTLAQNTLAKFAENAAKEPTDAELDALASQRREALERLAKLIG